jgi:hypothetical protein
VTLEEAFAAYEELYTITICEQVFYFRPITRKEYNILRTSTVDGFDFEDLVSGACTIFPEAYDFGDCSAGIPAMLCLAVLFVSGYGDEQFTAELLQTSRIMMNLQDRQMDAFIMTAFPQYDLERLQSMTTRQLYDLYAMAEWACREIRGAEIASNNPEPPNPAVPRGARGAR